MGKIINRYLTDVNWRQPYNTKCAVADSEVHIWRISISKNISSLVQLKCLLNTEETARAGRYHQQKDYHRFIISRAAQRIILGRYLNVPPATLRFILGPNKKPYLIADDGNSIHYNLSHSGNWILLAVAACPVGTDVELVDENFAFQDILPDNFSSDEINYITQGDATERFFTLWTRKEAILKATGQGLGGHLQVTPSLNGEHPLPYALNGAGKNWQLNSFNVHEGYIGSVAVEDSGQSYQFVDIGSDPDNYLRSL